MKILRSTSQSYMICLLILAASFRSEAQEIVEGSGDDPKSDKQVEILHGEDLQKKSLALMSLGKFDSSRYYIDEALRKFSLAGDISNLAKCYNILGGIMRHSGNFTASFPHHFNALKYYMQIDDSLGLAKTYNLIGLSHKELTNYDSAIIYYYKTIRIADKLNDTLQLRIGMMNAAQVYIDLEEYHLAKNYLEKCLQMLLPGRDDGHLAMILNKLGNIEFMQESFDSALILFEKSYKIYSQLGSYSGVATVRGNIGTVYQKKGDYEIALYNHQLAKKYNEKSNNKIGELTNRMNIAVAYEGLKEYRTAIDEYDTCLDIGLKLGAKSELKTIYHNLFIVYRLVDNYEKALAYHVKYTSLKDSIFDLERTKAIAELQLKYEQEKNEAEILSLSNKSLKNDLELKRASTRKNIYLTSIVIVLLLTLFTILFYQQRMKRNRIFATQKLKQAEDERKHASAKALLEGQEEERFRISRELHDGVGVLLSTASLYISSFEEDSKENEALVAKTQKIVSEANSDVRKISRNLMPSVLTIHGLDDAFADLIENFDYLPGKKGEFNILGKSIKFSKAKEIMIYRLVQEFVNNTIKHAHAESIELLMNYRQDSLIITYCDDGDGFDFNKKLLNKSVGLKSIQSRVDVLNGTLNFESGAQGGSCFTVSIPYEK